MTKHRLTLISAGPSPYARKVAVALHEKGLSFSTVDDQPWNDSSITARYSPLAQLPILLVDDHEPIYDSSYILTWLEMRYPNVPLLPTSPDERLETLRRQMLGERIMEIAQSLIFERQREHPSHTMANRQESKIRAGFATLDQWYENRLVLNKLEIDLGDIAVATTCMVITYLSASGVCTASWPLNWFDYCPSLSALCERLAQRSSFRSTVPLPMAFAIDRAVR